MHHKVVPKSRSRQVPHAAEPLNRQLQKGFLAGYCKHLPATIRQVSFCQRPFRPREWIPAGIITATSGHQLSSYTIALLCHPFAISAWSSRAGPFTGLEAESRLLLICRSACSSCMPPSSSSSCFICSPFPGCGHSGAGPTLCKQPSLHTATRYLQLFGIPPFRAPTEYSKAPVWRLQPSLLSFAISSVNLKMDRLS